MRIGLAVAVSAMVAAGVGLAGPASAADGYRITTADGHCLASTDGHALSLSVTTEGPCGEWNGTSQGQIVHQRTGKCLVMDSATPYLAECDGTGWQKWFYPQFAYNWGSDWTLIQSQADTGLCLGHAISTGTGGGTAGGSSPAAGAAGASAAAAGRALAETATASERAAAGTADAAAGAAGAPALRTQACRGGAVSALWQLSK